MSVKTWPSPLRTWYVTALLCMIAALSYLDRYIIALLADPIIRLIFEHGAFTSFDTAQTAAALTCYAYGLFAYSAVKIMVPVFYALDDTKYPVIGSFLAVAANIVIILLTIETFQHRAIALSTSCVMILNFFFLGTVLYRKLHGYPLAKIAWGMGKIGLATMVMAGVLFMAKQWLRPLLTGGITGELIGIGLLVAGGAAIYAVCLHLLGLDELEEIVAKVRARLGR